MFMHMSSDPSRPRLLRAVSAPLGSYYRIGRDYRPLQALIAEDRFDFTGLIFDAFAYARQAELLKAADGKLETILDTRALELSTSEESTTRTSARSRGAETCFRTHRSYW